MGYIKEPEGITFVVNKKKLTNAMENRIVKFINASKVKNKELIESIKNNEIYAYRDSNLEAKK